MVVVKSIDILTWAKIEALFGIIFGLFYGIMFALLGAAMSMSKAVPMPGLEAFGLLSIIIFPIMFAIIGFIGGAIMAFLYNVFAGVVGGVKVELSEQ